METDIVRYGEDPRQVYKTYTIKVASPVANSLVCIHGGAWRDPNNTYADFDELVAKIASLAGAGEHTLRVYSLDYRLSPQAKHPDHMVDVLTALTEIRKKDTHPLCVVGHSVGATLLTQVLSYDRILPLFGISMQFDVSKVAVAIFADGIYDVPQMLREYPSYKSFVELAFRSKEDWETRSTCTVLGKPEGFDTEVIVVHSTTDELLSLQQPRLFVEWLGREVTTVYEDMGLHEDVYRSDSLTKLIVQHL